MGDFEFSCRCSIGYLVYSCRDIPKYKKKNVFSFKKKKPEVRRVPFMTCALMDWTGGRYPASLPIATIWYGTCDAYDENKQIMRGLVYCV